MDKYIFSNFDAVRAWIEDNKLSRYNFRAGKSASEDRNNYIFLYDEDSSPEENMLNLERRLEAHAGLRIYGQGWRKLNSNVGGVVCEVQYGREDDQLQQIRKLLYGNSQGVGMPLMNQTVDKDELERSITEKLTMQFKLQEMEKERKDFERERKEFEAEKTGVIGALVQYFAPVAQALLQKQGLMKVAGTNVEAEKITPVADAPETETTDPDDLPDEESEKAYALLVRFRKVEPQYLELLESVVTMAENGDSMYTTAKSFLIKK